MRTLWSASLLVALLSAGCVSDPEPAAPAPGPTFLSPSEHLVRASMALRGTRPALEELRAVAADAGALDAIVDGYLDSEAFAETVRDMHNDVLLTRASIRPDLFGFPAIGALADRSGAEITRSVEEGPLRLVEHVVMNDRPYTEIVTADYTLADSISAVVWGLSYDKSGPAWQVTARSDGRPRAGLLSDSMLFYRHKSTPSNANRGRANFVSRALLCYDFAAREVSVSGVDVSNEDAIRDALAKNPACASCHQALDPLASFFFGHVGFALSNFEQYPASFLYQRGWEGQWKEVTGRAPGYFGLAGDDLEDLGALIAADPRFSRCAVQRFYAYLNQVDVEEVPFEAAAQLQGSFIDSGYNARKVIAAIVRSDAFRTIATPEGDRGYRRARPEQLARLVEDLTGYRWRIELPIGPGVFNEVDLATDATFGFAVLAGGVDSFFATRYARSVNSTTSLFLRAVAAAAAEHVVTHDLEGAAERKLLTRVEATATDEAALRAQLAEIHGRLYGELVTDQSAEVTASYELFRDALALAGDAAHAWKTTLTAMLQDPRILFY